MSDSPDETLAWVRNGWIIATKLLAEVKPKSPPLVSRLPSFFLTGRFTLFYAIDPISKPEREYWILSGSMPPCLIDAAKLENEREALREFARIYKQDGATIRSRQPRPLTLMAEALGDSLNDPSFGKFLEEIGAYLEHTAETFPWKEYGITGKVFSIKEPTPDDFGESE
jgi:Domain of unknown function (DUF4826)